MCLIPGTWQTLHMSCLVSLYIKQHINAKTSTDPNCVILTGFTWILLPLGNATVQSICRHKLTIYIYIYMYCNIRGSIQGAAPFLTSCLAYNLVTDSFYCQINVVPHQQEMVRVARIDAQLCMLQGIFSKEMLPILLCLYRQFELYCISC